MINATPRELIQEAMPPLQVESDYDFGGFDSDPMEKDKNEIKLEKVVFGDEKGFHDNLRLGREGRIAPHAYRLKEWQRQDAGEVLDQGIKGLKDDDVGDINSPVSSYTR